MGAFIAPLSPRIKRKNALGPKRRIGQTARVKFGLDRYGGVCEGNNVFAAGVPNLDTLGVRGGRIHSPEEFMIKESLSERACLSALMLGRIGDGRLDVFGLKALMQADHA